MESIAISELRANLMKVLKEIKQGAKINITSRGKVIAKLVPADNTAEEARNKLNELSQTALIGDIVSPIDTNWNVNQ
ncbi:MAG TPA: type II toxin-antitoxin system prevent-host-death family antitoxin [Bacteroidales bacterium]|nr:type II toxin-antitoxin system prevent-host-death family antitoxin [Bacteroidales bacterium]HRX98056.1 type II toxin-antitoxin system prevent-host-death family antitoxin [Bacteroidales bacterium]